MALLNISLLGNNIANPIFKSSQWGEGGSVKKHRN